MDKKGTRAVAEAYLRFLYTKEGQDIVAKHYYRPRDSAVMAKYAERYPATQDGDHRRFWRLGYGAGDLFRR